jgi:hypothetical protein
MKYTRGAFHFATEGELNMKEIRVLAPTGMLGTGFPEASLQAGLEMAPHFIGCDAGSTDSGPADLATGRCHYSAHSYRRDLKLILGAARGHRLPLIIGSAGGSGVNAGVDWTRGILEDVCTELDLHFRMAVIHSSQDKAYLKRKLAEGKIHPLANAPEYTAEVIDRSLNIVGMMGCEPIIRALEQGADVVLAGRSSDTSIYSAIPVMQGFNPGPVWHAAKVLECGAASVEYRPAPDCMFAFIQDDSFIVRAPNPKLRCTPVSVAAHSLYENGDPFRIVEPAGVLDTTFSTYEQYDDRSVKVAGSRFHHADRYTVKLEGAELVGYQTLVVCGIRDPVVVEALDEFLAACRERILGRVGYNYPQMQPEDWRLGFRVYGHNGTMGKLEPVKNPHPHEVGLVIEITAQSQELANSIGAIARHQVLHQPVPQWKGLVSNIALPYGAHDLQRGAVYAFNVNSVVEPADPYEMFPMEMVSI